MRRTHRDHHASAFAQLFKQWRGELRGSSRDHEGTEGRVLSEAVAAVAEQYLHVSVAETGECGFCRAGERCVPLHRINLPGEFREQRGLITGARTYLQTRIRGSER